MCAASTVFIVPPTPPPERSPEDGSALSSSPAARLKTLCSLAVIVMIALASQLQAQAPAPKDLAESPAPPEETGVAVELDGRPILMVYAPVGGFTAKERAEAIQIRIIAVAKNRTIPAVAIHSEDRGSWTEIVADNVRLMGITQADANAAERPRAEVAAEYTEILRQVVTRYREDHTLRRLLQGSLYAALATTICLLFITSLFWTRRKLRTRLDVRLSRADKESFAQSSKVRLKHYLGRPLLVISRIAFWIIVLATLQAYATVILRFFPATKYTSYRVTNWLFSELAGLGKSVIDYAPNLILLAFVCLITSYLIKVNEYFFGELRDEKLSIRGFYPDWAEPTAKLVRGLILVASVIVAFPYLPGSQSPAFKGISVFFGVLLSLGSTSAVAHAVAGTILTYMRAFQMGDFVRIGSDTGEVIERTLLVTRVCTQKNEVITIPNGTVLGGVVVNYSAKAQNNGVIFHTLVTIGYSAPWRQVHELLLSAARATDGILKDPPPFVLQTALNDFYVSYELNAYTAKPREMLNIYSVLHQNIQDKFNEAGVEINSPHYAALRDGNETTIPEKYVPKEYKHPVFEVREIYTSESEAKNQQKGVATQNPVQDFDVVPK